VFLAVWPVETKKKQKPTRVRNLPTWDTMNAFSSSSSSFFQTGVCEVVGGFSGWCFDCLLGLIIVVLEKKKIPFYSGQFGVSGGVAG
jgi:hypothetical protein